mmetsp:Transcript_11290/g.22974  ORF Transcript_11290/g.22974 Transcript_11290/m.22974 type:complete len:86 (-) Transcript_11290:129-386(-)
MVPFFGSAVALPPSMNTSSPLLSFNALQSIFLSGFQTSPSFVLVSQILGNIVDASSIPSQLGILEIRYWLEEVWNIVFIVSYHTG